MKVNVSSVQTFGQCRFRWWCEYVMGRVPVATSPALDAGRLLHLAFERHEKTGLDLEAAMREELRIFREVIPTGHPAAQVNATKAAQVMEDLAEALPLWQDKFRVDRVLEVEEPFEWPDPEIPGLIWVGRPDRVVLSSRYIWHQQRRGLAAGMNFGTYTRLALRHGHEHLYGLALRDKYKNKLIKGYAGTVFDLVRKLKFRTYVGKKNETTKTAEEMFYQKAVRYDLDGPLHKSVMQSLRYQVREMMRVRQEWEQHEIIPAPNEKMNGGYGGNSEDAYFRLLIGEVRLDDGNVFKDREDTYATPEATE